MPPPTAPLRVSTGQAGCNALAAFLAGQLAGVTVSAKWPDPKKALPRLAVTVVPVGERQREDVSQDGTLLSRENLAEGLIQIRVRVGSYMQPVQLDVWAPSFAERDDIIDRLDDALTAGPGATLGTIDDPTSDGILVALLSADGYEGNVSCWLDGPTVDDSAGSVQRSEFRATYLGEIRGEFVRVRTVARMRTVKLKLQVGDYPPGQAPPGTKYDTTTLAVNDTPPPAITVTHDEES